MFGMSSYLWVIDKWGQRCGGKRSTTGKRTNNLFRIETERYEKTYLRRFHQLVVSHSYTLPISLHLIFLFTEKCSILLLRRTLSRIISCVLVDFFQKFENSITRTIEPGQQMVISRNRMVSFHIQVPDHLLSDLTSNWISWMSITIDSKEGSIEPQK